MKRLASLRLVLRVVGLMSWCGAGNFCRAQGAGSDEFRFEHLTVNEGLAHSDAEAVVQDQAGFLWVGTNRGINRYDGYDLKKYELPVNPLNGLSGSRTHALHVARTGRLWAGTESAGLSWYDPDHDRFRSLGEQHVPLPYQALARRLSQADVVALASDPYGRLWVGTERQGVFVLQADERGNVRRLQQVALAGSQTTSYQVTSLTAGADGQVWIGTFGAGLRVLQAPKPSRAPAALVALRAAFPASIIRGLHLDRRGDLWVGTSQQVFWVARQNRLAARELGTHPLPQACREIHDLRLDSFGRLWVGTDYGLYLWAAGPATGTAPPVQTNQPRLFLPVGGAPFSLQSERIHQLFEDRNQVLWLASSAGGLNKADLRQKPFGHLQQQLGPQPTLPNNYVNAIYQEAKTNLLWIGTRNGFSSYDLARKTYRNYLSWNPAGSAPSVEVSSITQASDGRLWLASRTHGLYTLSRAGGRETLTHLPALASGPDQAAISAESVVEDRFGTMWVATFNAGLKRFSRAGQCLSTYGTATGLPTDQFTFLLYDRPKGLLWASTRNAGLLKLQVRPDSLVLLKQFAYQPNNPNSLAVNYTWPLLQDRAGTLWIGTLGGGLHALRTDAQGRETLRRCAWLPETDVESLLADEGGQLWIGGTGLYRANPHTQHYQHYDVADGLQSNSFKIASACRTQDGTLYFGGINGISYFQPQAIQANPYPPLPRITGLRVANKAVGVGETVNGRVLLPHDFGVPQTVTIQADENDFSVEFVGLHYATPQKHRYAYRLEGYNDDWVAATPGQRTASFTNLPPGNYTFKVKARNGDGLWSARPATLAFTVRPPWWKTWWAYSLYALVVGGALAWYRRLEMAQQGWKNKLALEQFRVDKERELTDLKLSFFTNVSHELRTPLTLILGPMEELLSAAGRLPVLKDNIVLMHRQTRKLLELVNQLLDFRKAEAGQMPLRAAPANIIPFLTEIFLLFRPKATEHQLRYELQVPTAEPVVLYFDAPKLEIVLTNLLANAFKYTSAGGITLAAEVVGRADAPARFGPAGLTDNYLQLQVRDQGSGMSPAELSRIFDPYYQAAQTDTLRLMGTGLGLALVKQLVERHGGEVRAESQAGQGTTFTVCLPFGQDHLAPADLAAPRPDPPYGPYALPATAVLPAPAAGPAPGSATAAGAAPGTSRLLIVEDNDDLRQYLAQLFAADFDVTLAADGLEGWETAQALLPDLIISDIMMPRSDGLELCRKIKQFPKTAHIPVVLLTARTAAAQELAGMETGADDYISKPFNPQLLHAKVAAMLRNRLRTQEFYQRQLLLEPTEIIIPEADKLFLEKAMQVVEDNLAEPAFNVQALLREMGMSQSLLYRRIKSITGQSAVEFIRDVRLRRAAQLLAGSAQRVSDIAYQVGMQDLKHFRTMFQKRYGVSPSEYARQHRGGEQVDSLLQSPVSTD